MKVLVTTPWVNRYLEHFQEEHPQVEFIQRETPEELQNAASDAEVAFGWVDSDLFKAAPKLRWIQSPSAGVEWMRRTPALLESDVVVTNTRGAHASTIAEHTLGMLIFLARGFDSLYESQKQHEWQRPVRKAGVGLVGLTMGIVGLGNIGRAIAKRAAAFEMQIIAVDAHPVPQPSFVSELRLMDGLEDLLRRSDVVVVTTPITPETRGMLSRERLALLKPSAFLLVVSRGGIVDETALAEMLHAGRLAGAGLDVAETEPLPSESPLWDAPNILITPHCSPSSQQTVINVARIMEENLRRYLAGEPLMNLVDKSLGY
ncbi:MAG: D-2-hydroxyacid dehydrogenase [Caldilineae bacterium]|nr:MAG: D-2-hydroxyacid dehydrogenase [Caldilineae bacterium]